MRDSAQADEILTGPPVLPGMGGKENAWRRSASDARRDPKLGADRIEGGSGGFRAQLRETAGRQRQNGSEAHGSARRLHVSHMATR